VSVVCRWQGGKTERNKIQVVQGAKIQGKAKTSARERNQDKAAVFQSIQRLQGARKDPIEQGPNTLPLNVPGVMGVLVTISSVIKT
jgi:hypothetical protein